MQRCSFRPSHALEAQPHKKKTDSQLNSIKLCSTSSKLGLLRKTCHCREIKGVVLLVLGLVEADSRKSSLQTARRAMSLTKWARVASNMCVAHSFAFSQFFPHTHTYIYIYVCVLIHVHMYACTVLNNVHVIYIYKR